MLGLALGASLQATAAVSFVQGGTGSANGSNVTFTFSSAQQAGDLNVIAIGGGSTIGLTSVSDTVGNTYSSAIFTQIPSENQGAGQWEAIYYAVNIRAAAAGANTVTVAFGLAPGAPAKSPAQPLVVTGGKVNVAEYSGIANTNALDVTTGSTGAFSRTGGTASSGLAATTNATDLLVGAYWSSASGTGGSGYTVHVGGGVFFIEDQTVSTTGSYAATAQSQAAGWWVMQLVALRAAAAGGGSPCD
jgi:hypothetical protein